MIRPIFYIFRTYVPSYGVLNSDLWVVKIIKSNYFENVFSSLIPTLTSNDNDICTLTSSPYASISGNELEPYKFTSYKFCSITENPWFMIKFKTKRFVPMIMFDYDKSNDACSSSFWLTNGSKSYIEYSDDGVTFHKFTNEIIGTGQYFNSVQKYICTSSIGKHLYYRIATQNCSEMNLGYMKVYGR